MRPSLGNSRTFNVRFHQSPSDNLSKSCVRIHPFRKQSCSSDLLTVNVPANAPNPAWVEASDSSNTRRVVLQV